MPSAQSIQKRLDRAMQAQSLQDRLNAAQQPAGPGQPAGAPAGPSVMPQEPAPGFFESLGRTAFNRYLQNALNIPEVAARGAINYLTPQQMPPGAPPDPLNLIADAIKTVSGGTLDPTASAEQLRANTAAKDRLFMPNAPEVMAASQTASELPGAVASGQPLDLSNRYNAALDAQNAQNAAMQEQHPVAASMGNIAGDAATLVTGRMPFAKPLASTATADAAAASRLAAVSKMTPGTARAVSRWLAKAAKTNLGRGFAKAAEAGVEGGVIQILHENSPWKTAALSAGAQMGGSVALSAMMSGGKISAGRIAAAAGTLWAAHRLAQEFSPGKDSVFTAADQTFNEMKWALTLGIVSGAAGAGRIRGDISKDFPKIMDAVTALPRGAVQSFIGSMMEPDKQATTLPVVKKLASDPGFFGSKYARELDKAMKNGMLSSTVEKLLKRPDFQKKYDELR